LEPSLFFETSWGIYNNLFFQVISFIPLAITFYVIAKKREKNDTATVFFITLLLMGAFLVAGSSNFIGKRFYSFLFNIHPFFTAFRNPFEKIGIILPLGFSYFFGFGLSVLNNQKRRLLFLSCFLYLVVFSWPLWTGKVFFDYYKVKVPGYYSDVNTLINKDNRNVKILLLPLANHGVNLSWQEGYKGGEPSRYLFDKDSIGRKMPIKDVFLKMSF
jgi:hypothetical protein